MPFQFRHLELPDVILIEPRNHKDGRGFFRETYKVSEFAAGGITARFVQDNHSHSTRGALRGLHYQNPPQAQAKLVFVANGEVLDVAVDIRKGSPTYGRWVAEILSADTGCMLYIPPGFAHGFCVLSAEADLIYKVTAEYAPELERGVRWNDPEIGVQWPITDVILSARDTGLPLLRDADNAFVYSKG